MAEDFDLSALINQAKEILATPEGEAQVQNLMGMLGQGAENQSPSPQADNNSPLGDVENIMKTNNPLKGLNIIKSSLSNYSYNNIKIFDFVNHINDKEDIVKLEKNDLLSRWSFLLYKMPNDIIEQTIDIFKLDKN